MRDYYIYLRKSRRDEQAEQFGQGETLFRHKKALLEYAKSFHLMVKKENILEEIQSGETIAHRPQIRFLIDKMYENKVEGVLVVDLDRLTRGAGDDQATIINAFRENNVKIILPMKTFDLNDPMDEDYIESIFHFSHKELKTITRRIQMGRMRASIEGKYVGNTPPYGYKRKKLTHTTGYTLEEKKEEADIVRYLFTAYTAGVLEPDGTLNYWGAGRLAQKLNQLQIGTRGGGLWSASTIRDILHNPVYAGQIRWNTRPQKVKTIHGNAVKSRPRNGNEKTKILVEGLHKPLISAQVWAAACAKNGVPSLSGKRELQNPLAGILYCALCGKSMVRRPCQKGQAPLLLCRTPNCPTVSTKLSIAEQRIVTSLDIMLQNYTILWGKKTTEKQTSTIYHDLLQTELKKVHQLFQELAKRRETILSMIELQNFHNGYSEEFAYDRLTVLNTALLEQKQKLIQLEKELEGETIRQKSTYENTLTAPHTIADLYSLLPNAQAKNNLLKAFLAKASYHKLSGGRWHNLQDSFTLKLYPFFLERKEAKEL